ncbi:MAG: hypothetical protein KF773_18195 [Deltaproteobacteria bacterium]|nr:hypothetical protein [Deltaproteobacteria bacterium]MCW5804189.1 hypothetical protein [Deltaproteobacteria bacterium]
MTDTIQAAITRLVQDAPRVDPEIADQLIADLRATGTPLALAIARIVELVVEQLVDPGVALPALAMACATLADGLAGRLTERELEAARYEIDTLTPMPDAPAGQKVRVVMPDVPATRLTRGRRPRT